MTLGGYQDTTGANPGVYRTDGVDLKASSDTTVGSGYVLGWRTTGERNNYTVSVAQAAKYTVTARVESYLFCAVLRVDLKISADP